MQGLPPNLEVFLSPGEDASGHGIRIHYKLLEVSWAAGFQWHQDAAPTLSVCWMNIGILLSHVVRKNLLLFWVLTTGGRMRTDGLSLGLRTPFIWLACLTTLVFWGGMSYKSHICWLMTCCGGRFCARGWDEHSECGSGLPQRAHSSEQKTNKSTPP